MAGRDLRGIAMVCLQRFTAQDAGSVREHLYPDLTADEAAALIDEWNSGVCRDRRFMMRAVVSDGDIVGCASLTERSRSVVSAGIEICPGERNKGFGTQAMAALVDLAASEGYRIVMDQVRTDNAASISLHEKLGFESDGYVYLNGKKREVVLYMKPL